jgi:hypothetical protein
MVSRGTDHHNRSGTPIGIARGTSNNEHARRRFDARAFELIGVSRIVAVFRAHLGDERKIGRQRPDR